MTRDEARERFMLNLFDLEMISRLIEGEPIAEWRIPYICKKVGVASREELVRFAIDQNCLYYATFQPATSKALNFPPGTGREEISLTTEEISNDKG